MVTTTYAIALGSNRPGRHGTPADEVRAAVAALGDGVRGVSAIITTAPLGPSIRAFANAVVLVESAMAPPAMLRHLKAIERAFGRRRGRRWGARVIDLDIVLWSGGRWRSAGLVVPHAGYATRDFVLRPLEQVAGAWRAPGTGRRVRHLAHMVDRRRPRP
ncbi:2-amino-4-hydroxy-6-hydroxymethyldihydropteridine diphosphokinase [Sphingomonas carotinifaciens]|uniref:2-amino-4-hydroxy-6-hydroxymethyldihydropteridine pyrophosphokinase n=1 Tax=Sphingomonas carotinifaciens TaxID=1166323 RepID=A0A6N8LQL2_9SPHN|nr:2-amino-4-hydroxy-6-hydroxymethyldihydropteridine diphosphokinase [Sphingomonas carotinifaciens]MBB4086079.1 2-amino-4-hydroxy-6-hydroxymethyldihydropteridine diphosphokinase [Sphingomonas carotinifaciens]MWC42767.1 2-amino-4-hydroxy-6-hydroxymethyldihydropteridine diphosphokinase [Sphingomonas carotinifaciens]